MWRCAATSDNDNLAKLKDTKRCRRVSQNIIPHTFVKFRNSCRPYESPSKSANKIPFSPAKRYTLLKINIEHVLMEGWKIIFLSKMGDGCRFQPLIFQGVTPRLGHWKDKVPHGFLEEQKWPQTTQPLPLQTTVWDLLLVLIFWWNWT